MLEESVSSVPSIWASMNSWLTPTVLFLFLNLMIGTIAITSSLATNKPTNEQQQKQQQEGHKLPHHHHYQPQNQNQLGRSPSVLERLKSINFYSYRSQESTAFTFEKPQEFDHHFANLQQDHHQHQHQLQLPLSRSPSVLQKLKSINLYNYLSQEPITKESTAAQQINDELKQRREEGAEQRVEEEENDGGIQDQEQTLDEIYSKLQSENKVSGCNSDTKPTSGEVPTKLTKKMKKSSSLKSAFANFEEDIVESRRPATVREKKSAVIAELDDAEVDAKADDFINRFKQQLKLQRIDSIIRYKEKVNRGSEK